MAEFQRRKVLMLSAGHFVNDCFSGFLAPLLPVFMELHHLSVAEAGLLASVLSMSTSLSQPLYGYWADRSGRRAFLFIGTAVTGVFISLLGLAPSYGVLLLLLVIAGAGSASFHPTAAAAVSHASGIHKEWGMSWFLTAGNFGHAVGPLVAVPVVLTVGLHRFPILAVAAVATAVLLYFQAPSYPASRRVPHSLSVEEMRSRWKPLGWLFVVVVTRAFLLISFASLVPIYLRQSGVSLLGAGATVTLFLAVGSTGALLGGRLSPILGGVRTLRLSMLVSGPALWGFLHAPGWLAFASLAIAGLFLYSSFPVNVVMAQNLFPRKAGTVSALMIGVGWGTAGALLIPAGILADFVGVSVALNLLAAAAVVGLVAAMALSAEETGEPTEAAAPVPVGASEIVVPGGSS